MHVCQDCGHENIAGSPVCDSCHGELVSNEGKELVGFQKRIFGDNISSMELGDPYTIPVGSSLESAIAMMNAEQLGYIIVTDADAVVGIFTERDALMKVAGKIDDLENTLIDTVMTRNPQCLQLEDSIASALHKMTVCGFRRIPIVEDGKLIGVISTEEVVHCFEEFVSVKD